MAFVILSIGGEGVLWRPTCHSCICHSWWEGGRGWTKDARCHSFCRFFFLKASLSIIHRYILYILTFNTSIYVWIYKNVNAHFTADPYKTILWNEDYYFQNTPKKIFCGDATLIINSRIFPILLWVGLFILPFSLLTVLSNMSDLGFLTRHPDVLIFGNISHFQIAPNNNCCNDGIK